MAKTTRINFTETLENIQKFIVTKWAFNEEIGDWNPAGDLCGVLTYSPPTYLHLAGKLGVGSWGQREQNRPCYWIIVVILTCLGVHWRNNVKGLPFVF